jgi:IclR family transcriptional regulator, mhp operon transcriptional activator
MSAMRTAAQGSNRRKSNGVARTLDILCALNRANGSTVSALHALTRVSRPALYRTLEQFRSAGYVMRDERGRFHLTHLVRTLSDGFRNEDRIAEAASAVLEELQRRVLWPTDLAAYANHAMTLRETTRRQSPLVIDSAQVGLRLPMLASAAGLAYLSFCDDKERDAIVEALRRSERPGDELARDERRVRQLVRQTRAAGYASRYMGAIPGLSSTATGSIALPLREQGRVCACIGITFFSKVLTIEEAARRHLKDLKDACADIEKRLAPRAPRV